MKSRFVKQLSRLGYSFLLSVFIWSLPVARGHHAQPRTYNGPGNAWDGANAMVVDSQGNIIVTGESQGNGSGYDYATVKYASDGTQLWVRRYNGPGNGDDRAHAIAIDNRDNIYVTGESDGGAGTGVDYATVSYTPDGGLRWSSRYDGPANGFDSAYSLDVKVTDVVYVTGVSQGVGSGSDYATVRYGFFGDEIWAQRFNGPANMDDGGTALKQDSAGYIIVTGFVTWSYRNGFDYMTIKYSPVGAQLWTQRFGGPAGGEDRPTALAVDAADNVYVTGHSYWGAAQAEDIVTLMYTAAGGWLWFQRYSGPGSELDHPTALAVDAESNVYVTGGSHGGAGTGMDYVTLKYSPNLAQLWVRRFTGAGAAHDWATAVAVDTGNGAVYVTGFSPVPAFGRVDYVTQKYASNTGNLQWSRRHNLSGGEDRANALCLDGAGNIYVTGFAATAYFWKDYLTLKYAINGDLQW